MFTQVPFLGWIQIIVFCGMVDFGLYRQGFQLQGFRTQEPED